MTPRLLLAAALLLPGLQAQEQVTLVRVTTADGLIVVGAPSIGSVKLESSVGTVDLTLATLVSIQLEGETAFVTGSDRSVLKGKLKLDEIKVAGGYLGDLTFKNGSFTQIDIFKTVKTPMLRPASPELPVSLGVTTKDGNELNGTAEAGVFSCETSLGTFEVDVARIQSLTPVKDGHVLTLLDGSRLRGKVKVADLQVRSSMGVFTLKLDTIDRILTRNALTRERKAAAPGPAAGPPSPANEPPKAGRLVPTGRTSVNSIFSPFRLSKDRTRAFAINRSDGKLCRWKLPSLEEEGSVALTGLEKALAIDPSGTRLFAAGEKTISVISAGSLKVERTFSIEIPVDDVWAVDADTLVVGGPSGVALVSVTKTATMQRIMIAVQRILVEGDRIYTQGGTILMVRDAAGNCRLEQYQESFSTNAVSVSPPTVISPDGRYGCSSWDAKLLRLGRCTIASKAVVRDVDRHLSAVFTPDSRRLYLFTEEGYLKVIEVQESKLVSSHYLGLRAFQAEPIQDGNTILIHGSPMDIQTRRGHRPVLPGSPGDLYRFEIPQ